MKKGDATRKRISYFRELELSSFVRVNYGTVDKHNPNSVSLELKTWTTTRERDVDYSRAVKHLDKTIRQVLHNINNDEVFSSKYTIVDVQYPTTVRPFGKDTYMSIDIVFKQIHRYVVTDKIIIQEMIRMVDTINTIFNRHGVFKFKKTKEGDYGSKRINSTV